METTRTTRQRTAGQCIACGKPRVGTRSRWRCDECQDKKVRRERRARLYRRTAGCCLYCHEDAIPRQVRCPTCQAAARAAYVALKNRRRAAGQCILCGKDAGGAYYCEFHRLVQNARRRKGRAG